MTISKKFVQKFVENTFTGEYKWIDTDETYEKLYNELATSKNRYFTEAREVEKIFDDHTFITTVKVLRTVKVGYYKMTDDYKWKWALVEE